MALAGKFLNDPWIFPTRAGILPNGYMFSTRTKIATATLLLITILGSTEAQIPEVELEMSEQMKTAGVHLTGPDGTQLVHRVEISTNLVEWLPLAARESLPWQYTDDEAEHRSRVFYRLAINTTAEITPHASWKNTISLPGESFLSEPILANFDQEEVRWVKFSLLLQNAPRVYYQDTATYDFHYPFANDRLSPFQGMSLPDFNARTLYRLDQEAILGAVLVAPERKEFAIQFVGLDAYPPDMLRFLWETVDASIHRPQDWSGFYFPVFEQQSMTQSHADFLLRHDIAVESIARWQNDSACYAPGWALGRLVFIPAEEIDAAYLRGDLLPTDILLTDGVPAEVPYVAGIATLTPATPNSHVAILARAYGIPFAYLADPQEVSDAQAHIGSNVVFRASESFSSCSISLFPALDLSPDYQQQLLDLKNPPPVDLMPKAELGSYTMSIEQATFSDIEYIGGKAANFGLLRREIPSNAPSAIAFTFDLWDAYLDQPLDTNRTLRAEINERLTGYAWPPDIALLDAELRGIRDLIKDGADFSTAQKDHIIAALQTFGFDPARKIRFRSSTNVEDAGSFIGAGLYDSFSGCLLDELDGDEAGPSQCDPTKTEERGVFRAIRKVYASFYNLNAYLERLRREVNESDVGMAILAHHSFPDEEEAANGVITARFTTSGNNTYLTATVITQVGAVSVTNPDGGSIPERVNSDCVEFDRNSRSCTLSHRERSSLLPLGVFSVLDWEQEYHELLDLAYTVATAYASAANAMEVELEFEFKKLTNTTLVIKQVREVPEFDGIPVDDLALVNSPVTLEVFQGERGDIFANHNLKSRFDLESASRWLDSAGLSSNLITKSDWTYHHHGQSLLKIGPISSWMEPTFATTNIFGTDTVIEGWYEPSIYGGANLEFHMKLPGASAIQENPVQRLADLNTELFATFETPQLTRNFLGDFEFTTNQFVALIPRVSDQLLPAGAIEVNRTATSTSGVNIAINFYWPPNPTGFVAGYTAPLQKWDHTTISGVTTNDIVLRNYFSQTYRPGHHNFTEEFLFEPRLETPMDQATLDELQSKNIRQIYVQLSFGDPEVIAIGFDNRVHNL